MTECMIVFFVCSYIFIGADLISAAIELVPDTGIIQLSVIYSYVLLCPIYSYL